MFDLLKPSQMRFDIGEQSAAKLSEMRAAPFDLEQLDTQLLLEAGDGVANGGLRAIELFGRRSEAAQLDDRLQDLPFVEGGKHDSINISNKSMQDTLEIRYSSGAFQIR